MTGHIPHGHQVTFLMTVRSHSARPSGHIPHDHQVTFRTTVRSHSARPSGHIPHDRQVTFRTTVRSHSKRRSCIPSHSCPGCCQPQTQYAHTPTTEVKHVSSLYLEIGLIDPTGFSYSKHTRQLCSWLLQREV